MGCARWISHFTGVCVCAIDDFHPAQPVYIGAPWHSGPSHDGWLALRFLHHHPCCHQSHVRILRKYRGITLHYLRLLGDCEGCEQEQGLGIACQAVQTANQSGSLSLESSCTGETAACKFRTWPDGSAII